MELIMRKHRKEALELQLTAMIDIFTMIVIFLIKATVFATADMIMPGDMRLPKSLSKELVESAPQLIVGKTEVQVSVISQKLPLADFHAPRGAEPASVQQLRAALKDYVAKIPPEQKTAGVFLNVMADKDQPYKDVFEVAKVFRESGFESLLFIAATDTPPEGAQVPAAANAAPGPQGGGK